MKRISFLLLTLLLFSCTEDEPMLCCTVIDANVAIEYMNAQGENLFETPSAPDLSEIDVYHKIDSEWVEYFEGNLDYPKGLRLADIEDQTYLVVFVNLSSGNDNISETKMVFPGGDEDVIRTEINKTGNNSIVTKVWFNDELKWETENRSPRRFTVVKE